MKHHPRFAWGIVLTTLLLTALPLSGRRVDMDLLPWENASGEAVPACLYLEGGFLTTDKGCPDWGTADPSKAVFLGDRLGDVVVTYASGKTDRIPLVLGYTVWMHGIWMEHPAPFKGDAADKDLADLLERALCLAGGFEGKEKGLLKIVLPRGDVRSVAIEKNPAKEAAPVFTGGWFSDENDAADFFATHAVKAGKGIPRDVKTALKTLSRALHTFESDFKGPLVPHETAAEAGIRFDGNALARIATAVVQCNIDKLTDRTDADGFIHTSYRDAPSWRYDGFGPYVAKANSYFDSFYSRDAGRAIMTLNGFHKTAAADSACRFGNRWMMYYPEHGLTLGGKPVPGHFSVIPNKPLIYSQLLTHHGWPTRYTRERFGEGFENLGNQETDGHGLMMMANWMTWKNQGGGRSYVQDNWKYLCEAAEWILWCFDNPDLSFVRDGLLYGETEAAMNDYTLYANLPCYLGLLCYAEMAASVGETAASDRWLACAEKIRQGIDAGLTTDNGAAWDKKHFGFFHDPVPTMFADVCGYGLDGLPEAWRARSEAAFDEDLAGTAGSGWFGAAGGIGYNHSMITQNALLLDRTEAAGRLLEALSKICYAPRLPEPYLVPEGFTADAAQGIYRRQGDLGNLVQQAEALKCYLLAVGISPVRDRVLKLMPRLPEGWSATVTDFPVQNTAATLSLKVGKPKGGRQRIDWHLSSTEDIDRVEVRFGPFKAGRSKARVKLNGRKYTIALERAGDAAWGWVPLQTGGD